MEMERSKNGKGLYMILCAETDKENSNRLKNLNRKINKFILRICKTHFSDLRFRSLRERSFLCLLGGGLRSPHCKEHDQNHMSNCEFVIHAEQTAGQHVWRLAPSETPSWWLTGGHQQRWGDRPPWNHHPGCGTNRPRAPLAAKTK